MSTTPAGDREIRALPVVAACLVLLTGALVVYSGRVRHGVSQGDPASGGRVAGDPQPVTDVDHFVPGSAPAVAERFLRAWMRARYDDARALATGPMRARAEQEIAEVGAFDGTQAEMLRRTRAFTAATSYDLDHVQLLDLPPSPEGRARKQVRGVAHARGVFDGRTIETQRGQTFVLEQVNGAWRVADRTWESETSADAGATPGVAGH